MLRADEPPPPYPGPPITYSAVPCWKWGAGGGKRGAALAVGGLTEENAGGCVAHLQSAPLYVAQPSYASVSSPYAAVRAGRC
jgi:hypothetical protein